MERFLRRVPRDTVVLLDEAYIEFVAPEHRIDAPALVRAVPECRGGADVLEGLRAGRAADRLRVRRTRAGPTLWTMQLPFGMGITSLVAVAASYDAEDQLRQRIRLITAERSYLRRRLRAMGVYTTDGHANFVYLPRAGGRGDEVFDDTGLKVRHYADGGARITVGSRASTQAVLSRWSLSATRVRGIRVALKPGSAAQACGKKGRVPPERPTDRNA